MLKDRSVYRLCGASLVALFVGWGLLASHANAQTRGKIAGNVVDAETGESLPGVSILIVGTVLGTSSDDVGDYFIANLEPGTYSLRATYIGYRDVVVENVDVNPNRTTEVNFRMESATVEVGEVVVTAERPLVEVDNTTSSIRLESTEVTSLPTSDFTSVLTTLPGVNFENGQVLIRGGGLNEVAFNVDGARARDPLTHSPYTRVNLSSVQEVEVITGSFNAEYGEAQSGVINVITKEGGEEYELFLDTRYEPAGKRHWGASFYDQGSPLYWENTHARHLEWWIEYPDQWTDPLGNFGTEPDVIWTPEQAYENYLETHKVLNDYTEIPTFQVEAGVGGPVPLVDNLTFYGTFKRRSEAPLYGNAFRDRGEFNDGTLKFAYQFGNGMKLVASGFFGQEEAGWGFYPDIFWALNYGVSGRYAYYDFAGHPYSQTDGQTLTFSHALNSSTLYEARLSRVQATRKLGTLPGDTLGFDLSSPTRDLVRPLDEFGNPITWATGIPVGYNTTGYYYRFGDSNAEWKGEGYISSQIMKQVLVKAGFEHSQYVLDHYNEFKPQLIDSTTYRPYQGALYGQTKVELGGLIINAGLRLDYYNPNDTAYVDLFDPFNGEKARTKLYAQLSPRIGISHPIDTRTKLHFAYGHFFQRPPFNQYGEQFDFVSGNLNTVVVPGATLPYVLGNRNLHPLKTIAFEVGIERNFWDFFLLDLTAYYKDSRNTIRKVTVETDQGTYTTNGNGNYADNRGVEVSLRKIPSTYSWGTIGGYTNFSTRIGIFGRSGVPSVIRQNRNPLYPPTGDFIAHTNPILKAGLYYTTPEEWRGVAGAVLGNVSASFDYRAIFPHSELIGDFVSVNGEKYLRPVDQNLDFRARKGISLMDGGVQISPYVEVYNLLNSRWVNLDAVKSATLEDQRMAAESGYRDLPEVNNEGAPIVGLALFRNLPRTVLFGVTVEL